MHRKLDQFELLVSLASDPLAGSERRSIAASTSEAVDRIPRLFPTQSKKDLDTPSKEMEVSYAGIVGNARHIAATNSSAVSLTRENPSCCSFAVGSV